MPPLDVLLVHPPIHDFTAYDFWLRPYGMMRVAGRMRHACRLKCFNFLVSEKRDAWGRGRFARCGIARPAALGDIPRIYRRFGRPRTEFRELLKANAFDAVLVQTSMTYWYPGVREVVEDVRELRPSAKIVLGGVYATLCPEHAESLGADLVVRGPDLRPLWRLLSIEPREGVPYRCADGTGVGILKITEGCPFRCTYCSAPLMWPEFTRRATEDCLNELRALIGSGAANVAFYDDALLYQADRALVPFLQGVLESGLRVAFHTPNALNARFVTAELARLMTRAGFAGFFLGLESSAASWQETTGGKVNPEEFAAAAGALKAAGARSVTTYIIVGHPDSEERDVERSIRFAHRCGTRVLLSEFSPIPGTVDGERCRPWADLQEPLSHNKTAFALRRFGADAINRLKRLTHELNGNLPSPAE